MRAVQKSLKSVFFLKIVAGDLLSHTHIEATGDEIVRQSTPLAGMPVLRPADEYETQPEIPAVWPGCQADTSPASLAAAAINA